MNLFNFNHFYLRNSVGKLFLSLFLMVVSPSLSAQETTLQGYVKAQQGEPLIGVTLLIDGTTRGTSTAADGSFTLKVTNKEVLTVSYLGYTSQKIAIGNRTQLDIVLVEEPNQLDEIVVVGYGTQKKRDVVGAIEQIKGEDLLSRPNPNVVRAMQGQVP
ncbi:MAG: carboxypeptidase-like regulatory domain-containing protein, partial [Alistipes sp.]